MKGEKKIQRSFCCFSICVIISKKNILFYTFLLLMLVFWMFQIAKITFWLLRKFI